VRTTQGLLMVVALMVSLFVILVVLRSMQAAYAQQRGTLMLCVAFLVCGDLLLIFTIVTHR